jgi:hypothetical protein
MRRPPLAFVLAPVAAGIVLSASLAGCAGGTDQALPLAEAAAPELAPLGWTEAYGPPGARLVFRVQRLEVRREAWSATVSVTNKTGIGFEVGGRDSLLDRRFGVMLFQTGDLRELEQRNRAGELPPVRPAASYVPALPEVLAPGATWRGVISAAGSLPARSWVRLSFGTFVAVGEPPKGLEPRVVWITDHAYPL